MFVSRSWAGPPRRPHSIRRFFCVVSYACRLGLFGSLCALLSAHFAFILVAWGASADIWIWEGAHWPAMTNDHEFEVTTPPNTNPQPTKLPKPRLQSNTNQIPKPQAGRPLATPQRGVLVQGAGRVRQQGPRAQSPGNKPVLGGRSVLEDVREHPHPRESISPATRNY